MTRLDDSNGAFGLYDDFPIDTITALFPGATITLNSGLGNTLIVNISVGSGVNLEVLFGPHGESFDTNVLISGGISAEFLGLDVNLASLELAGDGFTLDIGGDSDFYPANNLSQLTLDLIEAGASASVAATLTAALSTALQEIGALEDLIQSGLNGLQGGGLTSSEICSNEFQPDDCLIVETSWELNLEGDRLGTSEATVYNYAQGYGNITIYDYILRVLEYPNIRLTFSV